jgi:hypothetical protein
MISNAPVNFILQQRFDFMKHEYLYPSMHTMLLMFHSHESTGPHDKVYGLVGLVGGYKGKNFVVDYSLSTFEVYRNAARYIKEGSGNLDLLYEAFGIRCSCTTNSHSSLGVPSWVPNWSYRRSPGSHITQGVSGLGLDAAHNVLSNVVVSIDGKQLFVKGCLLKHRQNLPYAHN